MNDTTVRVPGKLYVAGEYGVVAGRSHAIVLPTKLCLSVHVSDALENTISSTQWKESVDFEWVEDNLPEIHQGPWADSLRLTYRYLKHLGVAWKPCSISIESELDRNAAKKWGLGSSGALTVALIDGVLRHHEIIVEKITLYQLCVFAQISHLEETSFGDIACSVEQKPLLYHMPSRDFLRTLDVQGPFEAMNKPWPALVIETLQAPPMEVLVWNTGVPAQSHKLVKQVLSHQNKRWFHRLTERIEMSVQDLKTAWTTADPMNLHNAVKRHHLALLKLSRKTGAKLVIPAMKDLAKNAKSRLAAWKFSGAGAGDNVLLFPKTEADRVALRRELPEGMSDLTAFIEGVKP